MKFKLEKIQLQLKVNWKISRNESLFKENFILSRGKVQSEIAPNIRYQENEVRIKKEFQELNEQCLNNEGTIKVQAHWSNSFKNAVANILLKEKYGQKLKSFLNFENKPIKTSYSIPIMKPEEVRDYLDKNSHFQCYKLKISNKESYPLLEEVFKNTDKPIRIDANEGFQSLDNYLEFEEKFQNNNIEFIEQPFKASAKDLYKQLKPISKFTLIADESVEENFDPVEISEMFHGINVKLMKAGGIFPSLELLQLAKENNLKTMLGCMIESSLGISEAMLLASRCDYIDLDGSLLVANDPFSELIDLSDGFLSLK